MKLTMKRLEVRQRMHLSLRAMGRVASRTPEHIRDWELNEKEEDAKLEAIYARLESAIEVATDIP
jgi:hypothetical protein